MVATQANVNVGYGPQAIDLLRQGLTAQQVLAKLLADDTFPGKDGRQKKVTYPAVHGVEAARRIAAELVAEAQAALEIYGDRAHRLNHIGREHM